jgi:hypothetical protein
MVDDDASDAGSDGRSTCGSPGLRSRGLPVLAVGTPAPPGKGPLQYSGGYCGHARQPFGSAPARGTYGDTPDAQQARQRSGQLGGGQSAAQGEGGGADMPPAPAPVKTGR